MRWEMIDTDTHRLKIPGGWIVRTRYWGSAGVATYMLFVADSGHSWTL